MSFSYFRPFGVWGVTLIVVTLELIFEVLHVPRVAHPNYPITKPRAHFLFSLLEGLSLDFPSHMIVSMIDIYQDTVTCDKLIFPSTSTRILTHIHIFIPSTLLLFIMGAISLGSYRGVMHSCL